MDILNTFLFVGLPYIAIAVFFIGVIYRYRYSKFTYSSLSSQFLEGRQLYWGSMPFHWGILFLFLMHLVAFLIPDCIIAFNRQPVRLLVLEIGAFMFGVTVLFGLLTLFIRRITNPRLMPVTSGMDITIELLLLTQVVLGLLVAFSTRWGSSWFATVLSPYLFSIITFQPDITAVNALPLLIKLHIIGAFLIFTIFPFTRLVHMLVLPLQYIWRPYQRVLWNWPRKKVRDPNTAWSMFRPKNN